MNISEIILENKNYNRATIVFFSGDLGAGKTTNIKNICDYFGVIEHVSSPTYVIIQNYAAFKIFKNIIHIDAYRLNSYSELVKLRFEEMIGDVNNLILIEWPEQLKGVSVEADMTIRIGHDSEKDNVRQVEISAKGAIIATYKYSY